MILKDIIIFLKFLFKTRVTFTRGQDCISQKHQFMVCKSNLDMCKMVVLFKKLWYCNSCSDLGCLCCWIAFAKHARDTDGWLNNRSQWVNKLRPEQNGCHFAEVNIVSGNGSVLSGNKPLPGPMMTGDPWHHLVSLGLSELSGPVVRLFCPDRLRLSGCQVRL